MLPDEKCVSERFEECNALLAAIVESSEDAIISEDLDGRICYWNKAAERVFGFRAEEAVGRPIQIVVPPKSIQAEAELFDRVSRGELIDHFDTVRLHKDGTKVDVSLTISQIKDAAGRMIGASQIMRDITARKTGEQELRRRKEELKFFLETAHIGLHRVGPDGTILWANAAEMEMLGYRPGEYIGHQIGEFHADETAINEILGTLGRGDRLYEYEARLKCKDGSIKHVIIDSSVLWENGRFVHTQCFTRDITHRKQVEHELQEAKRRNEQILDRITDGFIAVDNQWRVTYINRYAAEVFGRVMPAHEFLWQNLWESVPGLTGSVADTEFHRAMAEQVTTKFEFHFAPLKGWFEVTAYPSLEGLSIYFKEITARKELEEALRESEERFRTLADNIAQFAWMADEQGWIFWYNRRWFEYTGTTLEEMEGWGWQKVHHPDHVGRVVEKIRHSFATGEAWEDTFPLRGKDGQYRWFLSLAIPIRDSLGKVLRWFGTNTDITELKLAEEALRESEADLAKAHEELADRAHSLETTVAERTAHLQATIAELEGVSYSLSHDMRAPLRTIRSFSEIVLAEGGDKLGASEIELLRKSISAAGRMDRLIQDVLIYSRVSRESIALASLDVEPLLRQIIHERPEFQAPKAEIKIHSPLGRVLGHEAYLTQCITNLLDNAVKFVPAGRRPEVFIWSEAADGQVRLWFEDNGIGIPKEAQERVFGIFQRMHAEKAYPGTGIGLAIVRKAVGRMQGSVGVESEPDKGSRFWVQLPAGE